MSRKRSQRRPRRSSGSGMGFGIAGVGCVLLGGFLALSAVILCGGFGSSIYKRMPRVVEVSPPRPVSGTDPAPPPDPEPEPTPRPRRPRRPRPTPVPTPTPDGAGDSSTDPADPTVVAVEDEERIVASVTVAGDAEQVVAVGSDGTAFPLPATLPRGTYDLFVTFVGSEPFSVGTLGILDGTPHTVTCRKSLGLCRVR